MSQLILWLGIPAAEVIARAREAGSRNNKDGCRVILNKRAGTITVMHRDRLAWRAKRVSEGTFNLVSDPDHNP